MDPFFDTKPRGAFSALLADQDLAHLELVLRRSLACDFGGPLLPPSYWRDRLALIARDSHLSHTQIQTVHRLYLQIDAFEAENRTLAHGANAPPPEPPEPAKLAAQG